jgi:phosphoribosylaminoimidazole-succinocarboxamide synthase
VREDLERFRRETFAKCEELGEERVRELLVADELPVSPDLARFWLERRERDRALSEATSRERAAREALELSGRATEAAERAASAAEQASLYTRAAAWASAIAAVVALGVALLVGKPPG